MSDANNGNHYPIYEPIDSACAEMRLLEIKPGDYNDDLEVVLKWAYLPDAPNYMALSYVWGHKPSPQPCMVGGMAVIIKENLNDALRHFRKHYPSTLLWVDALRYIAWLGKPRDEDKVRAGMTLMQSLRDHTKADLKSKVVDSKKPYWGQINGVLGYMPRTEGTNLWYAWVGISEIFACEYWSRLWIQQEATSPKPIRFWFGDRSLDDDPYATIVDYLGLFSNDPRFPDRFRKACGYDDSVGPVIAARIARQEDGPPQFVQLLQEMRSNKCTDPLDRIFAPLGLASDVPKGLVDIDYRANIVDVYTNVAQVLILEMPVSLKAMSLVCIPPVESTHSALRFIPEPKMPSWVPDWRQSMNQPSFSSMNSIRDSDVPLYHPFPGDISAQIYRTTLSVTGIVIQDFNIMAGALSPPWDCQDGCFVEPRGWWKVFTEHGTVVPELELAVRRSLVGDRCLIENSSEENGIMRIWGRGGAIDWTLFDEPTEERDEAAVAHMFEQHLVMRFACYTRRMALLNNLRVAVLPAAAEVGDKIAAFRGGHSLYLLRPLEGRSEYQFVGECYDDSWVDGQLVVGSREEPEIIVLI